MFGYINVNGNELSEENKIIYKAYYCGLCRKLREYYNQKGRMLLNYDMTFLVILLTGLYENENQVARSRCLMHPIKPHTSYINEITAYAADMNFMLGYHSLLDHWRDDKKISAKICVQRLQRDYRKVRQKYPRQAETIERCMQKLNEYERRKEKNLDVVSGLTGEMLGEIFAWKQDEWYRELKTLGLYLGKFIYLMDAYEDLEKDEKKNHYNPLLYMKQEHPKDYETLIRVLLTSMITEVAKSFERLPILLHADILRNIIYSGAWLKYDAIQNRKRKNK